MRYNAQAEKAFEDTVSEWVTWNFGNGEDQTREVEIKDRDQTCPAHSF